MSASVAFLVPGEPVPKARARTTKNGTYTPRRTLDAQARVAAEWHLARPAGWHPDPEARYELTVIVHCKHRRRCDLDNLAKLVMDALNGLAWVDDAQIDILTVHRYHVTKDPHTVIHIERLDLQ